MVNCLNALPVALDLTAHLGPEGSLIIYVVPMQNCRHAQHCSCRLQRQSTNIHRF